MLIRYARRLLLIPLLLFAGRALAQVDSAHFRIRYVINIPLVDTSFVDNSARISDLTDFLQKVRDDKRIRLTRIDFRGTASPDGPYDFNVWLSENRLRTFKELVSKYIDIPENIIHANSSEIPWDGLRAKVVESTLPHREEILSVIDREPGLVPWYMDRRIDHRLLTLRKMYGGTVWESLKSPILRDLRYGEATFWYHIVDPLAMPAVRPAGGMLSYPSAILPPRVTENELLWMPHTYLKTNVIGLGMLMANLAVETDFAPHWSVTLPVYYSGVDWFKSTIKFRNFTLQPELRYWFSLREYDGYLHNAGFFLGAHLEMSYFNFAFDGKYRFQDYRGRTPALGGGLGFGYRMPLSRNQRWKLELSAGAGAYRLDYSLFDNTPDVRDGQWVERRKGVYFGLDQLSVSLGYTFDRERGVRTLKKKKGGRP